MFHLRLLWGDILKVSLTIQMELRHWNQNKWETITIKNHVREGCLRFSDKQLIYSDEHEFLPLPELSEPSSMVLRESQ